MGSTRGVLDEPWRPEGVIISISLYRWFAIGSVAHVHLPEGWTSKKAHRKRRKWGSCTKARETIPVPDTLKEHGIEGPFVSSERPTPYNPAAAVLCDRDTFLYRLLKACARSSRDKSLDMLIK